MNDLSSINTSLFIGVDSKFKVVVDLSLVLVLMNVSVESWADTTTVLQLGLHAISLTHVSRDNLNKISPYGCCNELY